MMHREKISLYENFEGFLEEDIFLVTSAKTGKHNIMPLTFKSTGYILGDLCISIYVSTRRYSCELLSSGEQEFVLCRGKKLKKYIEPLGHTSGLNINKIKEYEIELIPGKETEKVPVMKEAEFSYECKIIGCLSEDFFMGYKMFIGSLLGVWKHL